MPRAYGYAPADSDLWKDQQEKDAQRQKMFDSMDLVSFNLPNVCFMSYLILESHRRDHFR